jgi:hypothetical protein
MKMNKKVLYWIAPWLALIAFFVLLELALTAGGFTFYPTDIRFNISDEYRVFNQDTGKIVYATSPRKKDVFLDQEFKINKDRNCLRVFILGGSSVNYLGDCRYLKEKLVQAYPDKSVEIINAGGLSYGSSRLVLVLEEVLGYSPDLISIYDGHNEFEEECLTKEIKENPAQRLNRIMLNFRSYQLFSKGFRSLGLLLAKSGLNFSGAAAKPLFPAATNVIWGRSFTPAQRDVIYARFSDNLRKMIEMARISRVKIIVSTSAYDRIMTPPFYSMRYGDYKDFKYKFPSEELKPWIDKKSDDPMIEFEAGRILYAYGKFKQAKVRLENAFILDAQPHRANQIINGIVKKIAHENKVPLADVDSRICVQSKGGIPNESLFSDHCHLNSRGNELLLDEIFKTIINSGILKTKVN